MSDEKQIIIRLITGNKKDFLPLLLLGDEQESAIDQRYQRQGYASQLIEYIAGRYAGLYVKNHTWNRRCSGNTGILQSSRI